MSELRTTIIKHPTSAVDNLTLNPDGTVTFSTTADGALIRGNNLSDIPNDALARANIGLGTAATANVGIAANNVVQLDGSAKLPAIDGSQLKNLPLPTSGFVKAWCFWQFNGQIYGDFGVTSVTRNGVGDYTINFSSPFKDGNYGFACGANQNDVGQGIIWTLQNADNRLKSTTQNRLYTLGANNAVVDSGQNYASWFE
jgi:hypothetical protein